MNTPIAREYLATLPDEAVGSVLPGIKLSDGSHWLAGARYLGHPERPLAPGLHVRILQRADHTVAYLWLDQAAPAFALPACESGLRARNLAGQIHPWKALGDAHGIVYSECPPAAWLPLGDAGEKRESESR